MNRTMLYIIIEILSSLAGFSLLCYATNWMVTLAVFLIVFGNNLMKGRQLKNDLLRVISLIESK